MSSAALVIERPDLCVYIGRFSPFHNGHAEVLRRAATKYRHVLVLLGSVFQARTPKNPWTGVERAAMITDWCSANKLHNVEVGLARDFPYNDQLWIANIQRLVREHCDGLRSLHYKSSTEFNVAVTGADRDSSTFYLKYFPEWKLDLAEEDRKVSMLLSATSIREIYFGMRFNGQPIDGPHAELLLKAFLPPTSVDALAEFESQPEYNGLREEHEFNVEYRKPYDALPHPVKFITTDALIVQAGHILLVRRKHRPGKGLWALPGGHLEPELRLLDNALKEVMEETKIDVSPGLLRGSIKRYDNYDYPDRSLRGRTVTTCFLIKLPDFVDKVSGSVILPKVEGGDDAEKARWVSIDEVMQTPELFFEDHFFIIEDQLNKLEK